MSDTNRALPRICFSRTCYYNLNFHCLLFIKNITIERKIFHKCINFPMLHRNFYSNNEKKNQGVEKLAVQFQ